MIINQSYLFLIFTVNGLLIGLIFDFFRIIRISYKTSDIATYIEDTIFWVLTGVLILYTLFVFTNGEIRLYMFIGIVIGIILYTLLVSNYVIKINLFIIKIIKNMTKKLINIPKRLQKKEDFENKSRII